MREYIKDPCFHDAINILRNEVEKYANEEHLEIEIRLGYLEDSEFKTDIGKDFFDKIHNQLLISNEINNESWEKTDENSEDYFYNGRRLSITKDNPKGTCIRKSKLATFDFMFEGSGFDLRVSFSKEEPAKRFAKDKATYKRTKKRSSFKHKDLSYDLTRVTMEENTIQNHLYEVELEAKDLNLNKMSSHYFIHDCLLKIKDMVAMCEDIENEPVISFIKTKKF